MAPAEPRGAVRRLPPEMDAPPPDDARLGARFADGERDAAEEVIARFGPRVTRLVERMLGFRTDVEDVAQDVFVSALVARAKFRGESRLETWLTRIAVNRCRAFHRRRLLRLDLFNKWRVKEFGNATNDTNENAPLAADLDRRVPPPETAAIENERAESIRQIVANLPHKYREVVVLFYLEEMSAQETADVLRVKRNTVEVRLSRARKMLEEGLAGFVETGKGSEEA